MLTQRNNPSSNLPRNPARLIKAAAEGDLKTVQELLAAGLGINAQDSFGNTALIAAAKHGHTDIVQWLIEYSADVNAINKEGSTALTVAATGSNSLIVQKLINHDAKVNIRDNCSCTPLTRALIEGGDAQIILQLIEAKANVNTLVGPFGSTPLLKAIVHGRDAQIILELIEAKANVNVLDDDGFTPLLKAIVLGRDARIIQKLIEKKADVNITDKEGNTPLMEAIIHRSDDQVVQTLIDNGADVNTKDKEGHTLLVRAITHGRDAQLVQKIIEQKADVNAKHPYGDTPLQRAIIDKSDARVVQKLIEQKADVNVKDEDGFTPLLKAIILGRDAQVVQNLIDNGADVNATDKKGYTALMIAVLKVDLPLVESLLKKKATVNAQNKNGENALFMVSRPDLSQRNAPILLLKEKKKNEDNNRLTIIQLLLEAGAEGLKHKKNLTQAADHAFTWLMRAVAHGNESPDYKARVYRTDHALILLTKAASKGDVKTIQRLLKAGININAPNKFGETALMVAAENNHSSTVELLLENKAKIDEPCECLSPSLKPFERLAFTPLTAAAFRGHTGMVKLLLAHGARADKPIKYDNTPLMSAILGGNLEIIQLLLNKNAKVTINAKNGRGMTALMFAAMHTPETVKLLLEQGAKVTINAKNDQGATALMFAAMCTPEAVKLLLEQGAEVNSRNQDKTTALMFAACSHHPQAVKLLIEKKANVNATNKEGVTALFSAAHPIPPSLSAAIPPNNSKIPHQKTQESKGVHENKEEKDNPDTNQDDTHLSIVNLLVEAETNLEAQNKEGETPLTSSYPAVRNNSKIPNQKTQELKDVQKNKEEKDNPDTNQDDARLSIVKLLVEAKANLKAKNKKGETPLTSSYPAVRNFLRILSFFENTPQARALLDASDLLPEEALIESCMYLASEEYDTKTFYHIAKKEIKELQAKHQAKAPAKNSGKTIKPDPALKEEKNDSEKEPEVKILGNIDDLLKGLIDNYVPHGEKSKPEKEQQLNVLAWRTEQEALVRNLSDLSHHTSLIKQFNLFPNKSSEERAFQEAKTETELTQLLLNQFHQAANTQKDKRDLEVVRDNLPKLTTPLDSNSVEALKSICLAIIKNPTLDPFNKERLQILFNTLFSLLSPGQNKFKKYPSGGGRRS